MVSFKILYTFFSAGLSFSHHMKRFRMSPLDVTTGRTFFYISLRGNSNTVVPIPPEKNEMSCLLL